MQILVPGVWTAHFEDFQAPDSFSKLPISPPLGLVVNSACAYDQCPTFQGYYGPNIEVLRIDLFDDPKEGEPHLYPGDAKQYFGLVNEKIKKTLAEGKSVLVHCYGTFLFRSNQPYII